MTEHAPKVRISWYPPYSSVGQLIRILDGVSAANIANMMDAILAQKGTPQNPTDWSDPDKWIAERLTGQSEILARRIWEESSHAVNPRHIEGVTNFIKIYDLLVTDRRNGANFLRNILILMRHLPLKTLCGAGSKIFQSEG